MKSRISNALLIFILLLISFTLPGITVKQANANAMDEQVFLPLMMSSGETIGDINTPEGEFAALMRNHPDQRRPLMVQDPRLMQVAEEKAMDMASRDYFSHTSPEGIGPNYLVEQEGYNLPDWYCQDMDCNNVESIAAGFGSPEVAFNSMLNSVGHRNHLLGELAFYAEQTDYGIGFVKYPGSNLSYYWVIITARH